MVHREENKDVLLVKECLSGSEQAWNEFYCRYVSLVRSVVRRRLGSWLHDMEDVTQNVFATLVSSLKSYDPTYSLPTFVRIIAERTCIQDYRQAVAARRRPAGNPSMACGEEDMVARLATGADSQEEQLGRCELLAVLREAFSALGEKCRELLRLRYFEDLPYLEISKLQGSTVGALRVQAKRCLQELSSIYERLVRTESGPKHG